MEKKWSILEKKEIWEKCCHMEANIRTIFESPSNWVNGFIRLVSLEGTWYQHRATDIFIPMEQKYLENSYRIDKRPERSPILINSGRIVWDYLKEEEAEQIIPYLPISNMPKTFGAAGLGERCRKKKIFLKNGMVYDEERRKIRRLQKNEEGTILQIYRVEEKYKRKDIESWNYDIYLWAKMGLTPSALYTSKDSWKMMQFLSNNFHNIDFEDFILQRNKMDEIVEKEDKKELVLEETEQLMKEETVRTSKLSSLYQAPAEEIVEEPISIESEAAEEVEEKPISIEPEAAEEIEEEPISIESEVAEEIEEEPISIESEVAEEVEEEPISIEPEAAEEIEEEPISIEPEIAEEVEEEPISFEAEEIIEEPISIESEVAEEIEEEPISFEAEEIIEEPISIESEVAEEIEEEPISFEAEEIIEEPISIESEAAEEVEEEPISFEAEEIVEEPISIELEAAEEVEEEPISFEAEEIIEEPISIESEAAEEVEEEPISFEAEEIVEKPISIEPEAVEEIEEEPISFEAEEIIEEPISIESEAAEEVEEEPISFEAEEIVEEPISIESEAAEEVEEEPISIELEVLEPEIQENLEESEILLSVNKSEMSEISKMSEPEISIELEISKAESKNLKNQQELELQNKIPEQKEMQRSSNDQSSNEQQKQLKSIPEKAAEQQQPENIQKIEKVKTEKAEETKIISRENKKTEETEERKETEKAENENIEEIEKIKETDAIQGEGEVDEEMEKIQTLLDCDKNRCRLEPYDKDILFDIIRGHWELFEARKESEESGTETLEWTEDRKENNFSESETIRYENLIARDPKLDIKNGVVGIDFGTKSTVVVRQDATNRIVPIRIGTGNLSDEVKEEDFENPTIIEFTNVKKFMEDYQKEAGRPHTSCNDIFVSYDAYEDFRNCKPDDFYAYFNELKQWANREKGSVLIKDKQKEEYYLGEHIEMTEGIVNPIELYAYYIGLYINNMRNGIYLNYLMTFPVGYSKDVRDFIANSFYEGIKKSLPSSILSDPECMERFQVKLGISEPAAYAVTALEQSHLEPKDETEQFMYGIFDFGGGTTDFDFGICRGATEEEYEREAYDYVLECFGADSDVTLGGENILELLAYQVYQKNLEVFREKKITFTLPVGENSFAGSETLLINSQIARRNMSILKEELRPLWHQEQGWRKKYQLDNESAQNEVDKEGIVVSLYNMNGEPVPQCILEFSSQDLVELIKKRIQKGIDSFFQCLIKMFLSKEKTKKEENKIYIFLAGNSSKSIFVKELFQKKIEEYYSKSKRMADEIGNAYFELIDPLTGESENTEEYVPNAKTGVAYGLLKSRPGSSIKIEKNYETDALQQSRFHYYLGRDHRHYFDCKFSPAEIEYKKWVPFQGATREVVRIYYTNNPIADSKMEQMPIENVLYKEIHIDVKEDALLFIRTVEPDMIEYVVAQGLEEISTSEIKKCYFN